MYTFAALFIIFGLVGIKFSQGCRCFPPHPQKAFCEADFVIRGKVLSSKAASFWRVFTIEVQKVYKFPANNEWKPTSYSFHIEVQTADSTAACGLQMSVGETWVLAGGYESPTFSVNSCGWNRQYSDVTAAQREGLQGQYSGKENQNCQQCEYCREPDTPCSGITSGHTCPWPNYGCQNDICKYSERRCSWKRNCFFL